MPEVDGVTLCKHVRAYNIAIPVLMLTAKDDVEDRVLGLDSGADDYLVKPFDFDELSARIRALLRRPTVLLPAELKVKDLVLNPATKKVTRGGKEILLTTKEFGLLEYMMRNAGQVLTREQLLSHLWDFNFDSFSNVVDVHIKNLRKKIDHGKQEKLLETIRGVGYRVKK
ncbi:MAG: response regulator transcription factor [Actinomycetota bacterium]